MYLPFIVDSIYYGTVLGDYLQAAGTICAIAHSSMYRNFSCPTYLGEAYVTVTEHTMKFTVIEGSTYEHTCLFWSPKDRN